MGEAIKYSDSKMQRGRLKFDDGKTSIHIDKIDDFDNRLKRLKDTGGYFTLYNGRLTCSQGSLSFADAKDTLSAFTYFLYFINGSRCSAIIRQGIYQENEVWCDFTNYNIDLRTSTSIISWIPAFSIDNFNDLWQNFLKTWKEDADFLSTAIHWYVEANRNSGLVEGSTIMIQTAIELIYNWYIVERKKMLRGKDIDNLSASNKIRLLLSQLGMDSNDVPVGLSRLEEYRKNENPPLEDAPESFTQIRNSIVHPQSEKRKKLAKIKDLAKYEALQLGIWYVELSILKILNYNGKYTNRCLLPKFLGDGEDFVPWVKNESNGN
ncbi:MAG: hypothetical protein IT258_11840 [Saprospiraceae bacterium]|nr:hypothetical protein [Saprospiraceae bacterium]